ncbi:MAG TPA: hypothetical protein VGY99_05280 [Candidatus Binataceae bacterium]|nr:hypothetical protein [Candidatus Binataceae bacterium]
MLDKPNESDRRLRLVVGGAAGPASRRCKKCGNSKHWKIVDLKSICSLCNQPPGAQDIVGNRFLAALSWGVDFDVA